MAELGLLGVSSRRVRRGGDGLRQPRLASEELEYVDTSLRVILSVHVGSTPVAARVGHRGPEARYLVPQAQGEKIATYGLTNRRGQ
jgi:glutaryl-CoA dehydrogenase (non-decarboxylating)